MKKVREGYKKTLAGEIPEDWWYEELNKLVDKITDGTHKTPTYTESGIPFLRVTDIQKSEIEWSNVKYISQQEHLELIKRCNPEIGDILYSKNGTIGIPKIIDWDNEFSIFVSLCLIKMKKQNSYISNKYLEQFLKSDSCMRQIRLRAKQGTVTNLHLEEIRELIIPIPTIKEQEKIASILSTVDEQIDNVDALIEKNKELKKGLMQTLLTKGIGHTKFKKTEIGEIPEEWELESMNKIVTSTQLGTNTLGKENEKIPMLKMGNLTIGGFDFNKLEYISEEELEMNKEYILSNGDFLFNTRNTLELVGKSAVWNSQIDKAIFNSNIMRIKYCSKINDFYMGYYFSSDIGWKQLKSISTGTTSVAAIYTKDLMKIKVIIPSIGEQEKIVSILLEVDKKIEEYENKKQKLEELKKGLMQQLLTGMIRVTV